MAIWRDRRHADLGLALMSRRFPPPWSVEETDACFIVRDGKGQALTYVYCEEEPGCFGRLKVIHKYTENHTAIPSQSNIKCD